MGGGVEGGIGEGENLEDLNFMGTELDGGGVEELFGEELADEGDG